MSKKNSHSHVVIKCADIDAYLSDVHQDMFRSLLNIITEGRKADGRVPTNTYYVCNTDEPYAVEVQQAILNGEESKAGIHCACKVVMGYKLYLDGFLDELDRRVQFLFRMPETYDSYMQAKEDVNSFYVIPRKELSGEVVFDIYKKIATDTDTNELSGTVVDTVHWHEWWKYSCQIMKISGVAKKLKDVCPELDGDLGGLEELPCMQDTDFEPCAEKFEDIYDKYLDKKHHNFDRICTYPVQNLSYCIRAEEMIVDEGVVIES